MEVALKQGSGFESTAFCYSDESVQCKDITAGKLKKILYADDLAAIY